MVKKRATTKIYEDMVVSEEFCIVAYIDNGQIIYIFDGEKYIRFEPHMTFKEAYEYLLAIYNAIMTIEDMSINKTMLRQYPCQVVLHNANRIFRKNYDKAQKIDKNSCVFNMCNDLQLTTDETKSMDDCIITIENIEYAIEHKLIALLSPKEFEDLQTKYKRIIKEQGINR